MTKIRTGFADSAYDNTVTPEKYRMFRLLMTAAFVLYLAAVLYLVLGERVLNGSNSVFHHFKDAPYWKQVTRHIQLVPLKTIRLYAARLNVSNPLRRLAFVNLTGNLILFFPMGIFLPYFFPRQKNLFRFSAVLILLICCIEITQVFTLLGACDIDDLILNYAGAFCGFICFHILNFIIIRRKSHAGRNTES